MSTLDEIVTRIDNAINPKPPGPVWPQRFSGAYIGWGAKGPIFTGPEHAALLIGPPRSGKTSAVIIPAVGLWPGPAVITSTKPDVLNATAGRRQLGGTVWVWDPTERIPLPAGAKSLRWSPLQGCAKWETALERAWTLTHSSRPNPTGDSVFWVERSATLLACLLHAAAIDAKPLSAVVEWVARRQAFEPLDLLIAKHGNKTAIDLLSGFSNADPRESSGVYATADNTLAAYRNPTALTAANQPNFDPEVFIRSADQPGAVDTIYIVAPSTTQSRYAPIVCALLDQIRHHLTQRTNPSPPMLWALDEAANIAPLPTLPAVLADAGSEGLIVLTCLQDLSQARARWGQQADGFLTLHATTLLLPGIADTNTLRIVTTLAGRVDRPHISKTRTGLLQTSTTTSPRQLPLLPENVVAHGQAGYALRLVTTRPDWLALTPAHTTPWIGQCLNGAPQCLTP